MGWLLNTVAGYIIRCKCGSMKMRIFAIQTGDGNVTIARIWFLLPQTSHWYQIFSWRSYTVAVRKDVQAQIAHVAKMVTLFLSMPILESWKCFKYLYCCVLGLKWSMAYKNCIGNSCSNISRVDKDNLNIDWDDNSDTNDFEDGSLLF